MGNPSDVSIIVSVEYPIFSVNFENYLDTIFVLKRVSNVPTPMDVHLYNPYPNPFNDSCVIRFALPYQINVVLYIVPARWVGEECNDTKSLYGAVTASLQRTAIAILIRQQLFPGTYNVLWSACNQNGNSLPAGFYRIYLRAGDKICWRDVFLYDETTNLPTGLR